MYHSDGKRFASIALSAVTAASVSGFFFMPTNAETSRLTTTVAVSSNDASVISDTFALPPTRKKELKKPFDDVILYQFDNTPLGDRKPLLMVHGLRGEFYPYFRWQKVSENFKKDATFNKNYKIYFCRYPTLVRLENTTPKFSKAIDKLYAACNERPITIVALSMGGNLVYESMVDPSTESKIKAVMAMGSPFHGSPLFNEDWMQYSLYKRLSMPWTRVDHSLALKLYFNRNQNLLADLGWDDIDKTIPQGGKFKSKLLFGPKGEMNAEKVANARLQKLNENNTHIKRKFITYGGYMTNPYLEPAAERYLENAAMYPFTFWTIKLPSHLAREHPVLKLLNRDIACVEVSKSWKEKTNPPYLFALNDGITPLSSALFLPAEALNTVPLTSLDSVKKLRDRTDVKLARAFKDVDHLTYIDGDRPFTLARKVQDELRPEDGEKDIFSWMLGDIVNIDSVGQKLADDSNARAIENEIEGATDEAPKTEDPPTTEASGS
jgi:hypothetical protein